MIETAEHDSTYEKLTPQRKLIIDEVLKRLERGKGIWQQGWIPRGRPQSAITGKKYRGNNNFLLTYVSMARGYTDNRWLTYKQMVDKGWEFKRDAEGKTLGKNAGVTIEYFELRDRNTKEPFSKLSLLGMTEQEKQRYIDENVYPMRKYYRVFNGDIIDGIPALEKPEMDPSGHSERAERFLGFWSKTECPIYYVGDQTFYNNRHDFIMSPPRNRFVSMPEFYGTNFHEVGHSTGNQKRLNRNMGERGTPEYAQEELRVEIASMFLMQEFGIEASEDCFSNNVAYIQSWHSEIKNDPNALFGAIADAEKIVDYLLAKEQSMTAEEQKEGEDMEAVNLDEVQMRPSAVYIKPSEVAAKALPQTRSGVEMSGRGIESLARMGDREVVERAKKSRSGTKFDQLFNGISLLGSEENNERSLMCQIAVFTKDKKQLMRIFKASGQYRDEKPNAYYEKLAQESMQFVERAGESRRAAEATGERRKGRFANSKS